MNRTMKMLLALLIGFLGIVVTPAVVAAVATPQAGPVGVRGKTYLLSGSSGSEWTACTRFQSGGEFRFRSDICEPSVVGSGRWSELDLILFSVWQASFQVMDCTGPARTYNYSGVSVISLVTAGVGSQGLFSGPFIGFVFPCST